MTNDLGLNLRACRGLDKVTLDVVDCLVNDVVKENNLMLLDCFKGTDLEMQGESLRRDPGLFNVTDVVILGSIVRQQNVIFLLCVI